jgi:uncharacterized protein with beta-barrel porin domain
MTRKTRPDARPTAAPTRRRARKATASATPTPVAPSTLRRDLGRQASRFALLTAMTLAAGVVLAPGDARADCVITGSAVQCGPTTTTNTTAGANTPNDRAYTAANLSVGAGVVVDGAGLAVTNAGSLDVVNNGVIRVDPGVSPTAGGSSALNLDATGQITYSGAGDLINGQPFTGAGLEARSTAGGFVGLDVQGDVTGSRGIIADTDGTAAVVTRGVITGTDQYGILARGQRGVLVHVDGEVTGGDSYGVEVIAGAAPGVELAVTGSGRVSGRAGGISTRGTGRTHTLIDFRGDIDGGLGDGLSVYNAGSGDHSVDITVANVATAAGAGITVRGGRNNGTSIAASGDIVSGGDYGISVSFGDALSNRAIDIDVAGSVAGGTGIDVQNLTGRDDIRINVAGAIIGVRGDGVRTFGRGDHTITAGAVTAAGDGLDIMNWGEGTVSVDVGDIVSGADGVRVRDTFQGGDITVDTGSISAGRAGIDIVTEGIDNAIAIGVQGDIVTTGAGPGVSVVATNANSGNDIRIGVDGAVTGREAVYVLNAGRGDIGISVRDGATAYSSDGITAHGRRGVSIDVSGDLNADNHGVVVSGGALGGDLFVTGGANITGAGGDGVNVRNDGAGDVTVDVGDIQAGLTGVYVRDQFGGGDIAVRTGAIGSGASGVNVVTASGTGNVVVDTRGAVTAQQGAGIVAAALGAGAASNIDVVARAGVSGEIGLQVLNEGTGDIRVSAAGPIVGFAGDGVSVDGRAELNIFLGGSVTGAGNGVHARTRGAAPGGLNVSGDVDITALSGHGLDLVNDGLGEVFVRVGDITATGGDGVRLTDTVQGGDIDIRTGAVTALDGTGLSIVSASRTADVTVTADGPVRGKDHGVRAGLADPAATGDVRVTVNGDVSGETGAEVSTLGSGNVSFKATGTVRSTLFDAVNAGTNLGGAVDVVVGDVDGAAYGVVASSVGGDVSVVATGAVTARNGGGIAIRTEDAGALLVDVSGPILAVNGAGVRAVGEGAIRITTGAVTADEYGIEAVSDSETDDIVIVANGDVSASDGYDGVSAYMRNSDARGDIDLTARGAVTGDIGLYAYHAGTGDIRIRADGNVDGRVYEGIYAAGRNGVAVEINGVVAGELNGVRIDGGANGGALSLTGSGGVVSRTSTAVGIVNNGSGTTTIDLAGDIRADQGYGVIVADTAAGGDIRVTTGNISARDGAIFVDSDATGADIDITANGDLTSSNVSVSAQLSNVTATGDVRVHTLGAIRGGTGIVAINNGAGSIAMIADGDIDGGGAAYGVFADGRGAVSAVVNGAVGNVRRGVSVTGGANGTGDVALTGSGRVSGVDAGVEVLNRGSGATTVDLTGSVAATNGDAVRVVASQADAGAVRVSTGDLGSGSGNGVLVTSDSETADILVDVRGDIDAGDHGVLARLTDSDATGDIAVTTRGSISAGHGIALLNDGTGDIAIDALGDITAASGYGIVAEGRGAVSIGLAGTVDAVAAGVSIQGGAATDGDITLLGEGRVTARNGDAIAINNAGNGAVTIDLAGPVRAINGDGLILTSDADNGGDVDIRLGEVTALDGDAVRVTWGSPDADIRIVTDGAVTAGGYGVLAYLANGDATGDITVEALGGATGDTGLFVANAGSGDIAIRTDGDVTGTGDYGLYANGHGDIAIETGGAVHGVSGGIVVETDPDATGDIRLLARGPVSSADGAAIALLQAGTGTVILDVTGPVTATGTAGAGGVVVVAGVNAGDIAITTASVRGSADYGILASQGALDGDVSIVANGDVEGALGGIGVILSNTGASGDVSITANGASRGARGIVVQNEGLGDIALAINGAVTGTQTEGVLAAGRAGIDIATTAAITGATTGVRIENAGVSGDLSLTGTGFITGQNGDAAVALNSGSGRTLVNLTGRLDATNGSGLTVRDTASGGDIIAAVGEVRATGAGVRGVDVVSQSATANLTVAARGPVLVGGAGAGVVAMLDSAAATGDIVVRTDGTVSAASGIVALNDGSGTVTVTARGPVISADSGIVASSNGGDVSVQAATVVASLGQATGILAENTGAGRDGDVTVTAGDILAARGVLARNYGSGDTRVTTTGTVTSADVGVVAIGGGPASGDVSVDVHNITGGIVGLYAETRGAGDIDIAVSGVVEGATAALWTIASADQTVRITNSGTLRSGAGRADDTVIDVDGGGFLDLTNTGSIIGELDLSGDASVFDNRGQWITATGTSVFRGGDDRLVNAQDGSIIAGRLSGTAEVSTWAGLERFRNAGRLVMGDGGAGDLVATSADSVFAAGSTLQLDIAGQALADLFFTTGTLAIETGARLDVNFVQPLALNGRYVVARADGGLTGTFDFEDRLLSAFIGLRDGYTATTAYIEVGQLRALAEAALTRNQRETATGVDSLAGANALKDAVLLLPDDAAARGAFDQLSGEIHPAARRAMVDDSALARDAVLDRLVDDRAGGRVWGQTLISERKTDGDDNATRSEADARGLMFGAESRHLGDTVTVGLAGGWFRTDLDLLVRASKAQTETAQAVAYFGARMDRWGVRSGVGYGRTSTRTQREIAFPGFTASPAADYEGSVLQVFVDGGYRLPFNGGHVEPFANVTLVSAETDAFTETDGAQASLSGERKSDDVLISTAGVRFEAGRESDFALRGMAGWRSMTGDLEPAGRHAFAGGETFTVLGPLQSDIGAVASLEALWRVSGHVSLSAGYDGVFGTEGEDHRLGARMTVAF